MSRKTFRSFLLVFSAILSSVLCTDDRIYFADNERGNYENPPSQPTEVQPRLLFPFSQNFSIGLGKDRGHSFGISRNEDGISLSQSTSLGGSGPLAGSRSNSFSVGRDGIAASDANAYNVFGRSDAKTNAFSLGDAKASSQADVKDGKVSSGAQSSVGNEHNKVSSGASSAAGNGEATADADASAVQNDDYPNRPYRGQQNANRQHGFHLLRPFQRESGLGINIGRYNPHEPNRHRDSGLNINIEKYNEREPNQWRDGSSDVHVTKWRPSREQPWRDVNCGTFPNRNPECGGKVNFAPEDPNPWPQPYPVDGAHHEYYPQLESHNNQNRRPEGTRVSAASASSSASSSGNGVAYSHSSSQSNLGPNGPSSKTNNQVYTSGDAQSHAEGVAAGVQEDATGQTQGSFSSGSISGSSHGRGESSGSAVSENRGEHSRGEVNSSANGSGSATGTANAAAVSFDDSPNDQLGQTDDIIPSEFVRSGNDDEAERSIATGSGRSRTQEKKGPLRKILSDINSAVAGIFRH